MWQRAVTAVFVAAAFLAAPAVAQEFPPLLPPQVGAAIATEVSGTAAKRSIQAITLHHRMRGSKAYRAAAEHVRDRLTEYGLSNVEILALPADGKISYGTQRSRPAWEAEFAELWEQRGAGTQWRDAERVASWHEQPVSLAQDSVSGAVAADLVDVGAGASASDYAGKDVRGKLVLVSSQPAAAAPLAVGRFGAAGIVSWAQNQKQAWWGEDESLVRWGHLATFEHPTFAFMVSPARARAWQARLAKGETVRLRADVKAGRKAGAYSIPTAVIPGRDRAHEIVLSCHLDHQAPGANDNASGCAGILEVARTLSKLIAENKLSMPARSIRFIWPPEIEGTIALLNARPEFADRTLATIHLDMIGGNTEITKSVLRIHRSPASLPSFVNDVAEEFAHFVNEQSMAYADRGVAAWPLVDPAGDKRALQAVVGPYNEGSDHQVWSEGSWRIPTIYLADWPDRYIHTDRDSVANVDATKLRRAIFIAAASAWHLANFDAAASRALVPVLRQHMLARTAETERRFNALVAAGHDRADVAALRRFHFEYEAGVLGSLERFEPLEPSVRQEQQRLRNEWRDEVTDSAGQTYRRSATPKGPMDGFGYSYLDDRLQAAGFPRPKLLDRSGPQGQSFAYEALNLVDGRRSVARIRDDLSAIYGPVWYAEVAEFLETLEKLKLIEPAALE